MRACASLKNLALSLATLLLILGGLEIYLRMRPLAPLRLNQPEHYVQLKGLFRPGYPLWRYQEIWPTTPELDPLGYYTRDQGTIDYFFNQFGARWREVADQPVNKSTAIFLGDSYTYGFGLRFEDTFVQRLAQATGRSFLNFARPADDTVAIEQHFHQLRFHTPAAVYYGLHVNDLVHLPGPANFPEPSLSRLWDFTAQTLHASHERGQATARLLDPAIFDSAFSRGNFAALARLRQAVKDRGPAFRVILLPLFVDLRQDTLRPFYREIATRLAVSGTSAGNELIDLTVGWEKYRDQDLWVTSFDQHPNALAHKIIAERLAADARFSP